MITREETRTRAPDPAGAETAPSGTVGDLRYKALLDDAAWSALRPAIRARFSKRLANARTAVYAGEITGAHMSRAGWLLAQALRVVGAPLPLGRDTGMPATVTVTEDADGRGQFWTRIYGRRHGFPQVVYSSKRFGGPTGLEEYLGYGFGMALTLHAEHDALHFRSDQYFFAPFGRRLRLPRWLTPGTATISHIDRGGGSFIFRLELRHPLLGVLIHQTARFRDIEHEE